MADRCFKVEAPALLLAFLLKRCSGSARGRVKGLLERGRVAVDGRAVTRFDYPLAPGQIVSIRPAGKTPPPFPVLYEDAALLAVDKPAGLLTVAHEGERLRTAFQAVNRYVSDRRRGERVFVVHRLDRDTSGVLLFAKSDAVRRALQDGWGEAVTRRSYLAVTEGIPEPESGTVRSRLRETAAHRVYSAAPGQSGGKEAVTRYTLLRRRGDYALLEVEIDTGRKNQIRVHLSELGCPVAGDKKYGAAANPLGRLGLHARLLELRHPSGGEVLRLEAPVPAAFSRLFPR